MESRNRGYASVLSANVIVNMNVNANGSHARTHSNINTSIESATANVIAILAAVPLGTTTLGTTYHRGAARMLQVQSSDCSDL
jgi:hypothetical protein